jgi:endonuclease YncB( thermonuclease family)
VIDVDTIAIKKVKMRLSGIDVGVVDQRSGRQAKWALAMLCKGQTVRARITGNDANGRPVARCVLPDGRDLSKEIIKIGAKMDWLNERATISRPTSNI